MKILLWAPYGAGTHYWGPGTSAFRLYKLNDASQHQITLVHGSEKQGQFPDIYEKQVKLPTLEGKGILGHIKFIIAAYFWIKKNGKDYDIFHGISAYDYTFRPALFFLRFNKPTIIKVTGLYGGFGNPSILSRFLGLYKARKLKANLITSYIATSSDIKSNLLAEGILENKIVKISNGVDINKFYPVSDKNKIELRKFLNLNQKFTIIFVGGLTANKRISEIVEATKFLLDQGYNLQLVIVGPDRSNGVIINSIKEFIRSNDIGEHIIIVGKTERPELYLQASDIFVLPSKREGMANALLEAMACGLPCIVTEISGSRELIENDFNGLYTDGSSYDIASKILLVKNSDKKVMFMNNSLFLINKKYTSNAILKQYIDTFKSFR